MKKHSKTIVLLSSILILLFCSFYALTDSGGPPSGNTNAPGDDNCTQCHYGTLVTTGSNWNNVSLSSNIPSTGYVPNTVYTMTLSHTQTGISLFGFQLTVLNNTNNSKAGTIIITSPSTTQIDTGTRDYLQHTQSGTAGWGSIDWTFNWKAPNTNVGDVVFYAIVNASDNNNSSAGDMIIAKNFTHHASSLLPDAFITLSDSTVSVDDTVFLSGSGTNSPDSYSWLLTGGLPNSSTVKTPFVIYKSAGTYTVTLIARNSVGSSLAVTKNIYVAAKPTANITPADSIYICQGDSILLSANTGTGLTYEWNSFQTSSSIYVKTAGVYSVTVTNISGCSKTSPAVKVGVYPLPSVGFSYIQKYLQFSFADSTKHASSWLWEFGDSKTDSIQNPIQIYGSVGLYTVKLAVTDSNGCSGNYMKQVKAISNSIDERAITHYYAHYNRSSNIVEVNYELPMPENISINLLSQSGKLIKTLVPTSQKGGKYSTSIPTYDLSKGIYLISITNGSSSSCVKVLID